MNLSILLLATLPLLPPALQPAGGAGEGALVGGVAIPAAEATDAGVAGADGTAVDAARTEAPASAMVRIAGGAFVPQFAPVDASGDYVPVKVGAFRIDATPVTVGQYLVFLGEHPEWRRSRAPAVLTGPRYLVRWADDLDPGSVAREDLLLDRPITEVSWFAARAYCQALGARLPTTDEWEYVASASADETDAALDPEFNRVTRSLQARRPRAGAMPPVGRTFLNAWGVWDMHGLVWEWTSDFNSQMATGAGRDDQGLDRQLFCAAGSQDATDRSDYTAFLRYAHRTSLEGADASPALGFRCARDIPDPNTSITRSRP